MKESDTTREENKRNEINSTVMKKKHIDQKQEAEAARKNPDPMKYPNPGTDETEVTTGAAGMTTTKDS